MPSRASSPKGCSVAAVVRSDAAHKNNTSTARIALARRRAALRSVREKLRSACASALDQPPLIPSGCRLQAFLPTALQSLCGAAA